MKTFKFLSLVLFGSLLIFNSCDALDEIKDDIDDIQEELVLYGQSQGILIGSTGAYKITYGDAGVTGTVLFDGITYNINSSQPLFEGYARNLETDGDLSIVYDPANNPSFSFYLTGHDIMNSQVDNSSSVRLYNGEEFYRYFENGGTEYESYTATLNLVISDNSFSILIKDEACSACDDLDETPYFLEGVIVNESDSQITFKALREGYGNSALEEIPENDQEEVTLNKTENGGLTYEDSGEDYDLTVNLNLINL